MFTIFAIRHGETEENKLRVLQGQSQGRLAESGQHQALKLGLSLKHIEFSHVIVSDLQRTQDTWQWMGLNQPVAFDERLRERAFGKYEGLPRDQVMHTDFSELEIESKGAFFRRVSAFVDERVALYMANKNQDEYRELWLTHGGALRIILYYLCNRFKVETPQTRFDNTGLTEYRIQNGALSIERLNDIQHLCREKSSQRV
ncbi:MAG: histidine phosphatase family protein [Bacteroidota bacterium]|nr:histidine phosphatase family protein [Bacteroidota bacterium]MEC8757840.1 histidine phosphatase family protein [Bacteroidota bacterium]